MSKSTIAVCVAIILAGAIIAVAGRDAPAPDSGTQKAQSVLDRVKREKVIRAGYIKYPPFVIQDPKTGELSGYFIDLVAHIGELAGAEIKYEETNWGTMIAGLQTGQFDVVVSGVFRTIPRALEVTWPRPVLYVGISAIVKKEETRFKELSDFGDGEGFTVAVTDGEVGHEYAKRYLPKAKLTVLKTEDISRPFLDVISDRADFALGDALTCYRFAKEHGNVTDLFAGRPFYVFGTTVMIRRGDPEWLDFLNIALEFMELSGFTDRIERKYKEADAAWITKSKPWPTSPRVPSPHGK